MSVGLPSWQEFIEHLGRELGVEASDYLGPGTSYHTLAEYYRIKEGSIGPLRSWLDRNWKVVEEKVRNSKMHQLIVELDFPIIYTTNYDRNIEAAFEVHGSDYVKVANARDIAKIREGVTQIVKFHGDFDDDESLVITETDYLIDCNLTRRLISNSAQMLSGRPCCSSATACRISIFDCCSTSFGGYGEHRDMKRIGLNRMSSCIAQTLSRKPFSANGAFRSSATMPVTRPLG
jgi:hypothetical protein